MTKLKHEHIVRLHSHVGLTPIHLTCISQTHHIMILLISGANPTLILLIFVLMMLGGNLSVAKLIENILFHCSVHSWLSLLGLLSHRRCVGHHLESERVLFVQVMYHAMRLHYHITNVLFIAILHCWHHLIFVFKRLTLLLCSKK